MVTTLVRTTATSAQVAQAMAGSGLFTTAQRARRADGSASRVLDRMVEPRGIEPLTFAMPLQRLQQFFAVSRGSARRKSISSQRIEPSAIRVRYAPFVSDLEWRHFQGPPSRRDLKRVAGEWCG
jgi:hypothetical protein